MTGNSAVNGSMHSEINLIPMIDVLLVLLILFMVIVPAVPRGEAAVEPKAAGESRPAPVNAVVLEILKGQSVEPLFRINQQPAAQQELPARLAAIYANRSERVLFNRGGDQVSLTDVAQAIDKGHAAGADRVGIITPGAKTGL